MHVLLPGTPFDAKYYWGLKLFLGRKGSQRARFERVIFVVYGEILGA